MKQKTNSGEKLVALPSDALTLKPVFSTSPQPSTNSVLTNTESTVESIKKKVASEMTLPDSKLLGRSEVSLKEVVAFIKGYSQNCTPSASIRHYAETRRRDLLAYELQLLISGIDQLYSELSLIQDVTENTKEATLEEDLIKVLEKHLPEKIAKHYRRLLRSIDIRIKQALIEDYEFRENHPTKL